MTYADVEGIRGYQHSPEALEMRKGSTWDLDDTATLYGWKGIGIALSQHRDSDALDRSNWIVALESLNAGFGAEGSSSGWAVVHLWHWAVGWIEYIVFDTGRADVQGWADVIRAKLESYPVLDEQAYSEMEWAEDHPEGDNRCYSDDRDCPCGQARA